jgi:hypothetical protein
MGDSIGKVPLERIGANALSRIRIDEVLEIGEYIHREDSHQPRLVDGMFEFAFPSVPERVLLFGRDVPRPAALSRESDKVVVGNNGIAISF